MSVSSPCGFASSEPSNSTLAVASTSSPGFVMPTLLMGMIASFTPTDSQLINFLLHNSAPNFFITDCDLFGEKEPWEIWDKYQGFRSEYKPDDELYFFMSSMKKVSPKGGGSRINRTIGGGNWTQKEKVKVVCDEEDKSKPIGVKRKLRYLNHGSDQNSQWCLDEYTCVEGDSGSAIFRLRRNHRQCKSLCGICVEDSLGMKIVFHPTDSQLIKYYLDYNIAPGFIIYDVDLFGQEEPWEIWEKYLGGFNNSDMLYFYTVSMKKMSTKGNGKGCHFDRRVGTGTWNQKEKAKFVYDDEEEVAGQEKKAIGRKRKLRYVKEGSVHHGEWYLEEYTSLMKDGVVLILRRNERYKAPSPSISLDDIIPAEKKSRKRKRNATEKLVIEDSTVPVQQQVPDNVDDTFKFFERVSNGTWEFSPLGDFCMPCPPLPTECDIQALSTLDFPSFEEFITECDQEASAVAKENQEASTVANENQEASTIANIDDNQNSTGPNCDDITTWDFPIEDYCSMTSVLQGNCDDDLHFTEQSMGSFFADDFLMAVDQ